MGNSSAVRAILFRRVLPSAMSHRTKAESLRTDLQERLVGDSGTGRHNVLS